MTLIYFVSNEKDIHGFVTTVFVFSTESFLYYSNFNPLTFSLAKGAAIIMSSWLFLLILSVSMSVGRIFLATLKKV